MNSKNRMLYVFMLNIFLILIVTAIGSKLLNMWVFDNWWFSIPAAAGIQILIHYFINQYLQTRKIQMSLNKYDSLEYKKYIIDLPCASCFQPNPILMDFDTGSFECKKCRQKNKIAINIGTVIPTDLDILLDENNIDKIPKA